MSGSPIFPFQRGEPVIIGQRVLAGDPAGYTLIAQVKRTAGQVVPKADAAVVASFDVSFVPAAGAQLAHWLLTIPLGLTPGQYCTDVKFIKDGTVAAISDPAFLRITESVSG